MPKSLLSRKDCPMISNPIRERDDWVLIENAYYELKSRTDNLLVADFRTLDITPCYFLRDLVRKFPCCSIRLEYCSDWDEVGCYEICSDGKKVHVIEHEAGDIYVLHYEYLQKEENESDGDFAWAVLFEGERDEYHEQEQEYIQWVIENILSDNEKHDVDAQFDKIQQEEDEFWEWAIDFEICGLKERNELKQLKKATIAECYDYENGIKRIPYNDWEMRAWMDKFKSVIQKDEAEWENEIMESEYEWDFFLDEEDKDEQEKNRPEEYYDDYEEYFAELEKYYQEWEAFEIGYDVMCTYEEQTLYISDFPLYFDNIKYIYDNYDDRSCYSLDYHVQECLQEMSNYWDPIDFINFDDKAF